MAQPGDLEHRVAALEDQVHVLAERLRVSEQHATASRALAGGADRDVAEIRGEIREFREQNTRVLNAMREDLTGLRQHVDDGFAQVAGGFTEMRRKLDQAAAGQDHLAALLARLIEGHGGQ